jgi:hypothetical protein
MRFGRAAWMGAALVVLAGSNVIAQERGQIGSGRSQKGNSISQSALPRSMPADLLCTESSSYSFAGSFGAHYSPNRRFSVFGELGLDYPWQDIESSALSLAETAGSTFGVRSAVVSSSISTDAADLTVRTTAHSRRWTSTWTSGGRKAIDTSVLTMLTTSPPKNAAQKPVT